MNRFVPTRTRSTNKRTLIFCVLLLSVAASGCISARRTPNLDQIFAKARSNTGKLYDPVFLFMLSAVLLALMGSFLVRAAASRFLATSQDTPAAVEPATTR